MSHDIVILGVFVADTAYRAARQPKMGETLLGNGFALGPGGKGPTRPSPRPRPAATRRFSPSSATMHSPTWR